MQLTLVESSMIHAAGYDDTTNELEVIFNSGHIYRYRDVPAGGRRAVSGRRSGG